MFVIEEAIAGETVDGITDLFDSMLNVDTFQFHEDAGVLLRVRGMMTKKEVTLIVSGVGVKMPVNLVFVYYSGVATDNCELTLAFLYGKARGAVALRCFKTDEEIVC